MSLEFGAAETRAQSRVCAICLDPLVSYDPATRTRRSLSTPFSCTHHFHTACVAPVLQQGRPCPMCRAPTLTLNAVAPAPRPAPGPWHLSADGQATLQGLRSGTVHSLDLEHAQLGGASFPEGAFAALAEALQGNTTLQQLFLPHNAVGTGDGETLAGVLRNNTTLLFLAGNEAIAGAIQNNSTLRVLTMSDPITNRGAFALKALLQHTTALEVLWVIRCELFREGAMALAQGLRGNTSLEELRLDYNDDIGPESCAAFARALQKNTTLKVFSLSHCYVGHQGAVALAGALTGNTSLRELNLSDNNLGPESGAEIAKILRNTALKTLALNSNNLGPQGAAGLAQALTGNATLTELSLNENNLGPQGVAEQQLGWGCRGVAPRGLRPLKPPFS